AMTTYYPITLEELQNIPGVGAGKAKRYGKYAGIYPRNKRKKGRCRKICAKSTAKTCIVNGTGKNGIGIVMNAETQSNAAQTAI
ncbi:MAG: HRDC domain-containing protein, partial [Ruminococcus sp.]|nr:HRDC domain-containing protein [Ruminococcus sp.]